MPQVLPQAECSLCGEEFEGQDHLLRTGPSLLSGGLPFPTGNFWQQWAGLGLLATQLGKQTLKPNPLALKPNPLAAFLLLRSPSSLTIWMASGNPRLAPRLRYLPPFQLG